MKVLDVNATTLERDERDEYQAQQQVPNHI